MGHIYTLPNPVQQILVCFIGYGHGRMVEFVAFLSLADTAPATIQHTYQASDII